MRILAFVLVFLITTPAFAQQWYWGAHVGASFADDSDITAGAAQGTLSYDTGAAFGAMIGKSFGVLRGEAELTSRVDAVNSRFGFPAEGNVLVTALMGNLIYDFPLSGSLTPHFGAGIGYASVTIDTLNDGINLFADDSSSGLAYQFIAGVDIHSASSLIFFVDYRYLATGDLDFVDAVGGPFEMDYTAHTVLLGIRSEF